MQRDPQQSDVSSEGDAREIPCRPDASPLQSPYPTINSRSCREDADDLEGRHGRALVTHEHALDVVRAFANAAIDDRESVHPASSSTSVENKEK